MAAHFRAKAWSALFTSTGLEIFQITYHLLSIFNSKTALRITVMSRSYSFSTSSQRAQFDVLGSPVTFGQKRDKASSERAGTMCHAMRLLTLPVLGYRRAFFGSTTLYILQEKKLLKCNVSEQHPLTVPATFLVLVLLWHKMF